MSPLVVMGALGFFLLLFALLHRWQVAIEAIRRARVEGEIRDAVERGSDRPIAQHPIVDAEACIGCGSCVRACPESGVLDLVDGVARVVHGSRCVGHGRCAEACPVGALTVDLGDVESRTDLPVLSDRLESTVRGIHVAGELGGFALIRVAVEQGRRGVDAIAADLRGAGASARASTDAVDVLIAGAGPAGFAAALRATELGLSYRIIDQDELGGTVRKYPRRKLTLTGPLHLPLHGRVRRTEFIKEDLIRFWEDIAARHRVRVESGTRLLGVGGSVGRFDVRTSRGSLPARRVLLALGRRGTPRRLGVPGEEQEKVLYQLVDAATYAGERVLVVGGGNSAIEAATGLADQPGTRVTLSYRRSAFFRLTARNEERIARYAREGTVDVLFDSRVLSVEPDRVLLEVGADPAGGATAGPAAEPLELPNDTTLVLAGGEPPFALLGAIGVGFHGALQEEAVAS